MKKLFVILSTLFLVLGFSMATQAQTRGSYFATSATAELDKRINKMVEWSEKNLELTQNQKSQILQFNRQLINEVRSLNQSDMSVKQKTKKVKDLATQRKANMEVILSERQLDQMSYWSKQQRKEIDNPHNKMKAPKVGRNLVNDYGKITHDAVNLLMGH